MSRILFQHEINVTKLLTSSIFFPIDSSDLMTHDVAKLELATTAMYWDDEE